MDAQAEAVTAIRAAFGAPDSVETLQLHLTGPGVFAVESRRAIQHDARRLTLIATVAVSLLLLLVLRSPRFLLWAALPTATYNLKITKPIPVSEAILYIKSILALNGIAVTPLGERAYEVVALQNARAFAPELITGSAFDRPASGQIATKQAIVRPINCLPERICTISSTLPVSFYSHHSCAFPTRVGPTQAS